MLKPFIAVTLLAIVATGCARSPDATDASPSPSPTLPIVTGDFPEYGHAADFSWVAGRLVRSLSAGGCSYVMFSTRPATEWGGRIALVTPARVIDPFPDGDMVVVTGRIGPAPQATCGGVAVFVQSIEEH